MKQITPEIKARIFALYWGQEIMVWFYTGGEKAKNLCKVAPNHMAPYYIDRGVLEVKPLSSITDEDAIEVAKMFWKNESLHTVENGKSTAEHFNLSLQLSDYLRSKGYALPAFGYSVDELIESNVFKLKED